MCDAAVAQVPDGERRHVNERDVQQVVEERHAAERDEGVREPSRARAPPSGSSAIIGPSVISRNGCDTGYFGGLSARKSAGRRVVPRGHGRR